MLQRAGSPLEGEGATFVREGTATGIDPRALVAIAAHETILETYGPAQAIRNPFGLGPNWSFASEADAIARAASTLATMYIPEGRTAIPQIGAKWAPIGASNDPAGLNDNWTAGVGAYYAAMGGDPARPILLQAQDAAPACSGGGSAPAATDPLATTPSPAPAPAGPAGGRGLGRRGPGGRGHPRRRRAPTPPPAPPRSSTASSSPSRSPRRATASYRDAFAEPGHGGLRRRAPPVRPHHPERRRATPPWRWSPAPSTPGDAADREEGIAFWITTPGGDRLGYGPLASYAAGIGEGTAVSAGQPLGHLRRLGPDRLGARRRSGSTRSPCSRRRAPPPDERARRAGRSLRPFDPDERANVDAVVLSETGGPEVLRVGTAPDPVAGAGEVVVALRAAALNRRDVFVRKGIAPSPLPVIPGLRRRRDGAVDRRRASRASPRATR